MIKLSPTTTDPRFDLAIAAALATGYGPEDGEYVAVFIDYPVPGALWVGYGPRVAATPDGYENGHRVRSLEPRRDYSGCTFADPE